jgi:hypothetical protein
VAVPGAHHTLTLDCTLRADPVQRNRTVHADPVQRNHTIHADPVEGVRRKGNLCCYIVRNPDRMWERLLKGC